MPLHLLGEVLARSRIGEAQSVLVDEHRLVAQPLLPRLLRDVLENTLAELARIRREIQTLGLAAELDAMNHASHPKLLATTEVKIKLSHAVRLALSRRRASAAASCRGRVSEREGAPERFPRSRAR